jgi:hypothetical protein
VICYASFLDGYCVLPFIRVCLDILFFSGAWIASICSMLLFIFSILESPCYMNLVFDIMDLDEIHLVQTTISLFFLMYESN